MSKMAALGSPLASCSHRMRSLKGSISGYVFEQFEIACPYLLLAAAKKAGDVRLCTAIETILPKSAKWPTG